MATSKWAAAQATHARVRKCRHLLAAIGKAVEPYADIAAAGPAKCDWTHAGSVGEVRRQLQEIAAFLACPTPYAVEPEDACPKCGERDSDMLIWDEDGEEVRCFNCGATYKPGK